MDTEAAIILAIGSIAAAWLAYGSVVMVRSQAKTIKDQAETIAAQMQEIDALQSDNLRLRGRASELATLAHEGQAQACGARGAEELTDRLMQQAESMLAAEIEAHAATKRKLSAAKGQITKLRRML